MESKEFFTEIGSILFATHYNLDSATVLNELDGWDSLGRLSLAALLYESFGKMVDTKTLVSCQTLGDVIELIEDKLQG